MTLPLPESDYLTLSNWRVRVGIGAYQKEKHGRQPLILTVKLWGEFHQAAQTDRLEATLDYADLKRRFEQAIYPRRWELLESFADESAEFFLNQNLVQAVELTVAKPRALAPALISYTCRRIKSTQ
ncbi:MAG: dihydroneopterin aldolase [Spirochaetales bacterium]|nr:dihydroneopterin aldolase [Spirochaetales bacterium]